MAVCSLAGLWRLSNEGNRRDIKNVEMNIPGDNVSALLHAGLIADPYYDRNEKDAQWIGREDWAFSREFSYHKQAGTRAYLRMEMVDTVFTVFVNGKEAGGGGNFFRSWRFDVTELLMEGQNAIRILIRSPERCAREASRMLPYPVPYSKYDVYSPHRNLLRKIQCHAGWDWGPCLMVSGVYGDISIETVRAGLLTALCVNTEPQDRHRLGGGWNVVVTARYEAVAERDADFRLELAGHGVQLAKTVRQRVAPGGNEITACLEVDRPALWRSADELKEEGRTENELYTLHVTAIVDGEEDAAISKELGFRTLSLHAEPDEQGCSLYYELNGRPLFAKGANWIPVDALPSRWTKERYRYLLEAGIAANMNTMRVWGGGMYETDTFYRLCDMLGIIIWQDCAFACSLYPATDAFLADVEREVEDNVRRLQSHPSLAVWCGNNENLGALTWYEESKQNRDRYIVDYDRLNHGAVEKIVRRCDPGRMWWPSSPCAGPGTFGDNWHNDSEGDMHFWSVWHGREDMEAYTAIKPRFVSEFGFESFPSLDGIAEFAPEGHRNLTDPVLEYHQRSPSGNSIILENISRYFRYPSGLEQMVYLSQLQQALAVKTAVAYWRSLRPHCMGATYWQLNDVWLVTSWSSLEYSGKWKLLHYAARRFFAPLAFSLIKKGDDISAYIVNETRRPVSATVALRFLALDGRDIAAPLSLAVDVASDTAAAVWRSKVADLPMLDGEEERGNYVIVGTMEADGTVMEDVLFVQRWKRYDLPHAAISATVTAQEGRLAVRLSADAPAFYVALDAAGIRGTFSDNLFTLLPKKERIIVFTPSDYGWKDGAAAVTAEGFREALRIISLRDSYEE